MLSRSLRAAARMHNLRSRLGCRAAASTMGQALISNVLSRAMDLEEDRAVFPDAEVVFEEIPDACLSGEYDPVHATVMATAPNPFELMRTELATHNQRMRALLSTDNALLAEVVTYMFEETLGGKKVRPIIVSAIGAAVNHHEAERVRTATQGDSSSRGTHCSRSSNNSGNHNSNSSSSSSSSCSSSSNLNSSSNSSLSSTSSLSAAQRRLGEVTEMVHVASLLHDDVLDMADTRRGAQSINERFGNKMAVLTGDFLLSRASAHLARVGSVEVVALFAQLISDLVKGEIMQMRGLHSHARQTPFEVYVAKTYCKTGSLIANSCKAAAVLGSADPEVGWVGLGWRVLCS
jgi:hexaprenyl-diphosphate synthase